MEKCGIVPDIVDEVPSQILQIKYGAETVIAGNELTPTQVQNAPTVEWNSESGSYYTLVMIDPDAPNREEPTLGPIKHWLVVNIPGRNIDEGETIVEYIGAAPPEDSGLHRYIFLIYRQPGELQFDEEIRISNKSLEGRMKFSLKDFITKYDLGEPIGCNFFQAQYDDYVTKFYEERSSE